MKRILSLLLAVALVFALMAVPVIADDADDEGDSSTLQAAETGDGDTGDGDVEEPPAPPDGEGPVEGEEPPAPPDGEGPVEGEEPPALPDGEGSVEGEEPPAPPDGEESVEGEEPPGEASQESEVNTAELEATVEAGIEMGILNLEEDQQDAMEAAQLLLAKIENGEEVTQEEVDAAVAALNQSGIVADEAAVEAIEDATTESGVDYAALIAAIDAGNQMAIETLTEDQQTAMNDAIELLDTIEEQKAAVEAGQEIAPEEQVTQQQVDAAVQALNDVGIVAEDTSASGEASGEVDGETNTDASGEAGGAGGASGEASGEVDGETNTDASGEAGGAGGASGDPGAGGPGGAPGGMGGASGESKTYNGEEVAIVLNTAVEATDAESEILAYFCEILAESTDNKITVTVNYGVEVELDEELDTLEALADGEAQIVAFARTEYRNRLPLVNAVPDFTPATAQNTVDYYKALFQDDENAAAALEEEGKENGAAYLAAFVVKDEVGDGFSGGNLLVASYEWWDSLSSEAQEFILQAAQDAADYSAELIDGSGASGEASGEAGASGEAAAAPELTDEELEEWTTAINSAATRAKNTATEHENGDQIKAVLNAAADFIGVDRPTYDF